MRRSIVMLVLLAAGVIAQPAEAMKQPTKDDCTVPNADATQEPKAMKPAVKLSPEPNSQARVVNFGGDREPEFQRFTLTAEPKLPEGAEKQLSMVADVMTRTGNESADTVTFPDPRFTPIAVSGNGKRLVFGVCLSPPEDLPAGKYTGLITTDGPDGIEGATVSLTANAKNGKGFLAAAAAAMLIALLFLLYKGVADTRERRMEAAKNEADPAKKAAAADWKQAWREQRKDIGWYASILIAIGGSAVALVALWDNDPAWGDEGFPGALIALVAAALAAVGAKTVLSSSSRPPT